LGYVRLATFNSNTTAAAQEAFYDLQKQGVAGLVLDIRNNGGGLFPAGEIDATNRNGNFPLRDPLSCTKEA
jgi:C-terminal processing protease CtpA/Prc